MITINVSHDLGMHVKIRAIDVTGFVDAISKDNYGTQYRIVYWLNGKRETVWMYESELEEISVPKEVP